MKRDRARVVLKNARMNFCTMPPLSRFWLLTVFSLVALRGASAVPVSLGTAANYAVVGVGGSASTQSSFEIYQSDTVINGNVAEGPFTNLTHGIDATVNGRWDYDTTDANPA